MRMTKQEIDEMARPADLLFPGRQDAQRTAKCVFDPRHDASEFKDELSRKEYRISGMCQACQDGLFDA